MVARVATTGDAAAGSATVPGMNSGAGSTSQGNVGESRAGTADGRAGLGSNGTVQPGATGQNNTGQDNNGRNAAGQSSGGDLPAPGSIVAQNGNVAIRATGIPGVLLANDIHGLPFSNASGMLLGAGRDVHLDGGSTVVLAVAMSPQAAGSGMTR